jgi:hypothetical protein
MLSSAYVCCCYQLLLLLLLQFQQLHLVNKSREELEEDAELPHWVVHPHDIRCDALHVCSRKQQQSVCSWQAWHKHSKALTQLGQTNRVAKRVAYPVQAYKHMSLAPCSSSMLRRLSVGAGWWYTHTPSAMTRCMFFAAANSSLSAAGRRS